MGSLLQLLLEVNHGPSAHSSLSRKGTGCQKGTSAPTIRALQEGDQTLGEQVSHLLTSKACSHCKTQKGILKIIFPRSLPKSHIPRLSSPPPPTTQYIQFSIIFLGKQPPTIHKVSHLYYLGISTFTPLPEFRLSSESVLGAKQENFEATKQVEKQGESSECCAVCKLSSYKCNHRNFGEGGNLNSGEKRLPISPNGHIAPLPWPREPQVGERRSQSTVGTF